MAIDIRARVTCNLGEVISASISDGYVQGTGLIQTSGSCQIKGIITPNVGDSVVFQYTKSGITRRVPRTMRVLSSFADPFRRVTDVELGCKLTYLQDSKDPIKLIPSDDPENSDLTEEDAQIITFPTYASSVMSTCLDALGIPSTSIPLTNKFSVAEFDLSSGYVSVLSDLLVSESYCGYLDENETLNIIDLSINADGGLLISSQDLIDIGPIGVGQLPGDAVFVNYSSLKLKSSDDSEEPITSSEDDIIEDEVTVESVKTTISIAYTETNALGEEVTVNKEFEDKQTIVTRTDYEVRTFRNSDTGEFERKSVAIKRTVDEERSFAAIAGAIVTQYLENGIPFGNFGVKTETIEKFSYDRYGNEELRTLVKTGPYTIGAGMLSLQYVFPPVSVVPISPLAQMILEEVIVETETNGEYKKIKTSTYGPWVSTIPGQQSVAESRESLDTVAKVFFYLQKALAGRFLLDYSVSESRTTGGEQSQPLPEDKINARLAEDTGDPNNGFSTESVAEIEFVSGSELAQRRIELSMPYAPDDAFSRVTASLNPRTYNYFSIASDAPEKANRFGRIQNQMLLGNRSGMSIQTVPEKIPNAPFTPIYIEAAGTINLYRVNAASWTMDSSGIIASVDAMFWGTAGSIG